LSSRYVRLESTGVLKGFTIFFTATAEPVNWSRAELRQRQGMSCRADDKQTAAMESQRADPPHQAKGTHAHGLQISISRSQGGNG
jgi:hypothetical protein